MSRFVITITPDNGDTAGTPGAETTVRVDTSSGHTRITELTVRAADGGGLAPTDLPAVDLDLLIRALAAPPAARALPPETEAEVVPLPAPSGEVEPAEVAAEPSTAAPGRQSGEEAATTASGRRAVAKAGGRGAARKAPGRTAATKAGGRRAATKAGRRAARKAPGRTAASAGQGAGDGREAGAVKATGRARKAAPTAPAKAIARARKATPTPRAARSTARAAKSTARAAKAAAAGERATRAYRRMPDPAEVLAVYQQTGSITKLAEHYGVPRHTANGWARRLRSQGHPIGRSQS